MEDNNQTIEKIALTPCSIMIDGIKFAYAKNEAAGNISVEKDTVKFIAGPQTDYFRAPDGSVVNSAPVIFTEVDNTKPFTFTSKVEPQFTETGTYSAGALYAYENDRHSQKLCFEQSEDGLHRVVTVRTIDTSDDNNHQAIQHKSVYLRLSSDSKTIGCYYSEDGNIWHMARLYRNDFPGKLFLGLSAQSPRDNGHICYFSEVALVDKAVLDFRNGNLSEDSSR